MSKLQIRLVSPHLTIYKPQFNSILSIFYRASGVVLFIAFLLLGSSIFNFQTMSSFSLCSLLYVPSFFLTLYYPWISSIAFFVFFLSFYYHLVFGLDTFDFFRLRPLSYMKFDEFHLGQLSFIFKAKLIVVFLLSLVSYFLI